MQQRGVLRDHADLLAQAVLRHLRDVLAVDQDAPALDVVEAQQQVDDRRLARARAADQADLLAGPDVQVELLDHVALAAVGEAHLLEADVAARDDERLRVGRVDHRVLARDAC